MTVWPSLACLTVVLSAALLYAASPNGLWIRGRRPVGLRAGGLVLAAAGLVCWIAALGPGAGGCAMLASAMAALLAQPCLALLAGRHRTTTAARAHD